MSQLDDILNDTGAALFCKGQDGKSGFEVDEEVDKAKQQLKDLMLELAGEVFSGERWYDQTAKELFSQRVNEL